MYYLLPSQFLIRSILASCILQLCGTVRTES